MVKLIVAWPVAVIEFEYNHRSFQKKASAMRYLTSLKEKNNEIWDKKTSCKQIVKREDKGVKKICRAMLEGSKKSRQYFPFAILCHTQWTSALLRGEKSTTKEKNTKKTPNETVSFRHPWKPMPLSCPRKWLSGCIRWVSLFLCHILRDYFLHCE